MNDADKLLHLVSELGVIKAPRLKRTCSAIAGNAQSKDLRSALPQRLCRAGHAERRSDGGLSIAPSTMLSTAVGSRLLFGARDQQMSQDAETCGVTLMRIAQTYEPEIWQCDGPDRQIEQFAQQRDIFIANLEPLTILSSLPPITSALLEAETVEVPADAIAFCRWNPPARHQWQRVAEFQEEGFYRTIDLSHRDYFYWDGRETLRKLVIAEQRDAARWLTGERSSRLRYDASSRHLGFNYTAPLPVIVERCLRCVSGSEPTYERTRSRETIRLYAEIPYRLATEIARVLECRLEKY